MHRSRRARGVSIVEWVVLLAVIAAAGLGLMRSFFPHVYSGADRAGQCIENGDGSCSGEINGGPALATGDTTPTATATVPGAVNSNMTASDLVNQAGQPPSTGNPWQDWWNNFVHGWNQFWQSPFGQILSYVLTGVLLILGAIAMILAALSAPLWLAVVLVVGAIIGIVAGLVVLVSGIVGVITNNQTLKTIADIAGLIGTIAELPGMAYDLFLAGKNIWQGIQAFREGATFWESLRTAFGLVRDECAEGGCKAPNSCFVAGTPVLTPEGPRPIEALRPGDRVLSRDAASGRVAVAPIVQTYVRYHKPILALAIVGALGGVEVLRVTPDHPFWVQGRGWVQAGQLDLERDRLADDDGYELRVVAASSEPETATVYNFQVAETHSYFVGDAAVWVHNADYPPETSPDPDGPGKRPWKDGAYHGRKPRYVKGVHDPSDPNFRGGGSKTTVLPDDAEDVYKNAIPDQDGRTWWGRNKDGEYYRYQGSNNEVHWNGREKSDRGLKVPKYIKDRFKAMDQAKGQK